MIKKIVSLLLALVILLSISFSVFATDEKAVPISLNVKVTKGDEEDYPNIEFISSNGDLYIGCSDIAIITRYQYAEGAFEDSAYYSLGDKSVNFFYEGNRVTLPNQKFEGKYNGAIQYENNYYLSLSSVLPWLDCDCDIVDGRLTFTSEPITFFEITKKFRSLPSVYLQDYLKEGKNAFSVLSGANALNNILNGGESIRKAFTAAFNGNNPDYFYYDAYLNAFIEMASDDHAGSDAAADVFKIFKKIRNVNKITKQFGFDLSKAEVSDQVTEFMTEYGLDASLQNDVYEFFDLVKGANAIAKGAKYAGPFAESMVTYEACFNSINGYKDALELLINNTSKNSIMHKASNESLEMINSPYKSTIRNYLNFVAEESIEKGLEKIISFDTYDVATIVAKMVFSKTNKGVSEYSKITVYADICYTSQDIAKEVRSTIKTKEQQNGKNAMLLSALATKKTLECISSWKDKISDPEYVDECIFDCNNFIVQLLVSGVGCEEQLISKSENDESLTNWEENAINYRKVFSEAVSNPVVEAPKKIQLKDYIGMTIDEIAEIIGEDYKVTRDEFNQSILYFENTLSQCRFMFAEGAPDQTVYAIYVNKSDSILSIINELTNQETYSTIKNLYPTADIIGDYVSVGETACDLIVDGYLIHYGWIQSKAETDVADYITIRKYYPETQTSQTNNAQYEPESNFEYREQTIFKYVGTNKHVVIPPTIGGKPVTKITFPYTTELTFGAFYKNTNIETVVVPSGVINIGFCTFFGCTNLKEVILPETLNEIGKYAFKKCTSLSQITLPNGIVKIPSYAFAECSSLTTITIPEGTKYIELYAFKDCKNLSSVRFPNTISYLNSGVFSGCDNLTDIYYSGTEDEFSNITISGGEKYNKELYSATIHFNS